LFFEVFTKVRLRFRLFLDCIAEVFPAFDFREYFARTIRVPCVDGRFSAVVVPIAVEDVL